MKKKHSIREVAPDAQGKQLSRREFLQLSGSGVFIFFSIGPLGEILPQPRRRSYPTDVNAYLKIGEDGRVSLFCSKIEMGQGIITSMAQMLAEELDVSVDSIDMVMGDTRLCPWDSGTTGSRSTKFYGPPLRKAGAEARAILLQLASESMKLDLERLVVTEGVVRDKLDEAKQVSYAELVRGRQIDRHMAGVPIKSISEHKVSGRSFKRTDARSKVKGLAQFTADIRLPGMLYAKVLRPPTHDASLLSVDLTKAESLEGVRVIHEEDFIAVLHEHPEQAEHARSLIDAKWEVPEPRVDNHSVFDYLKQAAPAGRVYTEQGDLLEGHAKSEEHVVSEFHTHYVAHAPLEPYAVVAFVEGDKATIWASTQAPFRVQATAAETLNIPEEQVHVRTPFLGGGFGGKKSGQQISEAVRLSELTGFPVQLAWTRKEEFFYDAYRPAALVSLKSGLDSKGLITYWDCELLFTGSRSSEPIYGIPHFRVSSRSKSGVHPFNTGAWRGPGSNTNVFAMESHTDILAQMAGMDPYSFRMLNLQDERMIRVLEAASDTFGQPFEKGPSGLGYGISCTNYLNTYVATIAQVSLDASTGKVKVERVVCAQDMGEIINPQGARLQIEGGITMGLSAALSEELEFSGGEIRTTNFDSYQLTRFSDAPPIDVILIDNPDVPPQGCGEPAITTVGAALANAIFDAAGARVYTLPMTPDRILSAISGKDPGIYIS